MALRAKIDSNEVGFRYAREESLGVLPVTPDWLPGEANDFDDMGAELTLLARDPINDSRQRLKGSIVDLDASGGFNMDLTGENLKNLAPGVFMAEFVKTAEEAVTAVDIDSGNPDEYEVASTTGFIVGSLIKGFNFTNSANNAVNPVTAVVSNTSVEVANGALVAEASPPATAYIKVVGFRFAAGDLEVVVTGDYAHYHTTTQDLTTALAGVRPGDLIWVGGDATGLLYPGNSGVNNGWKRVCSISTNDLYVDKSDSDMAAETITTETIEIYFGDSIRNETAEDIVDVSFQFERTLGAPDTSNPTDVQAEYIVGGMLDETKFNIGTADKVNVDFGIVALDAEQVDAATGVKSGNRPTLVSGRMFNTSSDISMKMWVNSLTDESPTPLFAHLTEFNLTVKNNITPNKSIGTLGAFALTKGTFEVSAEVTAYFTTVDAIEAVRNNEDVSISVRAVAANKGVTWDLPLIALGNARVTVEKDEPIMIPLDAQAASGADVLATMNHTLLMNFFAYLPDAAE